MDSQCFMMEQLLLQTYFDIIPFHIYVVDVTNFEVLFVNKKMRQQFSDIDLSYPCHEIFYDKNKPCSHCKIKLLTDEKGQPNDRVFAYEYYNEAQERWYQMHEKSLAWPDGRIVKYTIAVDISEQKYTQNQLAEAHAELALKNKDLKKRNELLRENVRLREDMERMMHHDLKGPLSPIISIPEMYLEDGNELSDDLRSSFDLIARAGTEILDMINRSQGLILLERGTYKLKYERFDVIDQLVKVSSMLESVASFGGVSFEIQLNGAKLAYGDTMELEGEKLLCHSMFSNLIKNAIEASPGDSVVRINVEQDGEYVVVTITNSGEVPKDVRRRFFDKYATSGKDKGTGLGTYSANLIARAHNGTIGLDLSVTGQTSVVITLPRKAALKL